MLASIIFAVFFVAVTLFAVFLCGRFTAAYAARRGRSRRAWFFWGALFSPLFPIPWMVLGLLPKK